MRTIAINFLLLLFSLLAALIIAEIAVRLFIPQDLSGAWRELSTRGYLLNKDSEKSRHQLGTRVVYYQFNKFHLRSPEIDTSKFNILVFGDSFTFGWLLDEKDTYVSILQKYANDSISDKIRLLNAGAGGWGTMDFLNFLEEFGDNIKPDMVTIFMNGDDIGRSIYRNMFFSPDNPAFRLKSFVSNLPAYSWLLEHSHLIQLARKSMIYSRMPERPSSEVIIPSTKLEVNETSSVLPFATGLFEKIKHWCDQRNIPLVVTTTGWLFYDESLKNDPTNIFLAKADSIFTAMKVPFCDITPACAYMFIKNSEYSIAGDHHPNEKGALGIATASWPFLKRQIQENYPKSQ